MIYILPGMGADATMYGGPWRRMTDWRFVDWPAYRQEVTIAQLARRMVTLHGIREGDIVAGSSLGGMVALEIARLVCLKRVVLMGSALGPHELSRLARRCRPLAQPFVVRLSQLTAACLGRHPLLRMYARSETAFIVGMSRAIFRWNGFQGNPALVRRIHGRRDWTIRCPVQGAIIADGWHLIAVSHAETCVAFVQESIQ